MVSGGPRTGWVPVAQASGHLMASVSSWGFHPLYDDSWWVKLPWVSLEWSLARREEGLGPLKPQHQAGSRVSGGPADTRHPSAKTEARGWCGRGSTLAHPAAGRPVPRPWRSSPSARLWAQRRQWKGQGPGEMGTGEGEGTLGGSPVKTESGARSPQLHVPVFSS